MIQRLIFLTVFSLLAPCAFAKTTLKCHIRGQLTGDPQFAWSTGRDAWQGRGLIECFSFDEPPHSAWKTDVILRFESFEVGAGVGRESVLEFASTAIYTDSPLDLTRRFVLAKDSSTAKPPVLLAPVELSSLSTDCPCRFIVRGFSDESTKKSFNSGSLEIFVPQFSPGMN